jgi:outer membrane biosynthesis protein TonB
MSVLFDEHEADSAVIQSLLKEIRRLTPMSLVKLADGNVIEVESIEAVLITQEDLVAKANELTAVLAEINALITDSQPITIPGSHVDVPVAQPDVPAQPETPTTPTPEVPAQPEQPVEATPVAEPEPVPVVEPNQPVPVLQ